MVEASRSALGIDTSVPNIARMYDYWLGGKDNFAADREAAERMARAIPQLPWLARQNRDFLRRAGGCPACRQLNIVRDGHFAGAVCDSALPMHWNISTS